MVDFGIRSWRYGRPLKNTGLSRYKKQTFLCFFRILTIQRDSFFFSSVQQVAYQASS